MIGRRHIHVLLDVVTHAWRVLSLERLPASRGRRPTVVVGGVVLGGGRDGVLANFGEDACG